MKVAMIGSKGVPATIGGVERHVEELSARLAERGIEVTVYCRPWYTSQAPRSVREHRGVRLVSLPSIRTKHLDAITHTFLAALHAVREGFDVYHFHGVGPALLSFLPRLIRPRSRVIVTFHCIDRRHAKWGRIARAALALGEWAACLFPHETITVGETLHAYCRDQYGLETICIPNGVSSRIGDWGSGIRPREILGKFALEPRRYLLVVTRLVPHKGVHTTIAAFRQLRRERADLRDLKLAVVGAPSFTDTYADELATLAAGDQSIRFLGARIGAELDTLYRHCLAFVHASASEGLPIVVLEAAAAGAVPIVSDIPEHREVIERIGGFMFRVGDEHDLRHQIETIIACERSLPRIGREIRAAVLRHYDWDMAARRIAACYRNADAAQPIKLRYGRISI